MSLSGTKVGASWLPKIVVIGLLVLAVATFPSPAQNTQGSTQSQSSQTQGSQTQAPPAAGGPSGDIGPIAVPKKKPEEEKPVERAFILIEGRCLFGTAGFGHGCFSPDRGELAVSD